MATFSFYAGGLKSPIQKRTALSSPFHEIFERRNERERISLEECLKHEMDLYFSLSAAFEVTAQNCARTCAAISQSALTSHSRVISHMAFMAQLIGSKNLAAEPSEQRFQITYFWAVLRQPSNCHWDEWKCPNIFHHNSSRTFYQLQINNCHVVWSSIPNKWGGKEWSWTQLKMSACTKPKGRQTHWQKPFPLFLGWWKLLHWPALPAVHIHSWHTHTSTISVCKSWARWRKRTPLRKTSLLI